MDPIRLRLANLKSLLLEARDMVDMGFSLLQSLLPTLRQIAHKKQVFGPSNIVNNKN